MANESIWKNYPPKRFSFKHEFTNRSRLKHVQELECLVEDLSKIEKPSDDQKLQKELVLFEIAKRRIKVARKKQTPENITEAMHALERLIGWYRELGDEFVGKGKFAAAGYWYQQEALFRLSFMPSCLGPMLFEYCQYGLVLDEPDAKKNIGHKAVEAYGRAIEMYKKSDLDAWPVDLYKDMIKVLYYCEGNKVKAIHATEEMALEYNRLAKKSMSDGKPLEAKHFYAREAYAWDDQGKILEEMNWRISVVGAYARRDKALEEAGGFKDVEKALETTEEKLKGIDDVKLSIKLRLKLTPCFIVAGVTLYTLMNLGFRCLTELNSRNMINYGANIKNEAIETVAKRHDKVVPVVVSDFQGSQTHWKYYLPVGSDSISVNNKKFVGELPNCVIGGEVNIVELGKPTDTISVIENSKQVSVESAKRGIMNKTLDSCRKDAEKIAVGLVVWSLVFGFCDVMKYFRLKRKTGKGLFFGT